MRIRNIKPEFWTNERMAAQKPETRLLALALLNWADDEGYFSANPALIRGAVFPFSDNSVSIHCGLSELFSIDFLRLSKCSQGRDFGWIVKFTEHQKVNRPFPSKIKTLCDFTIPFTERSLNDHCAITAGMGSGMGNGSGNGMGNICPSQTAATNGSSLFSENDGTASNQTVITSNQTEQNLITEKPKKKKEPPKQLNGYNAITLWIDAVYRNMHVKTKLVGKDMALLNILGNMYDKFEYPAMLKAYEEIWHKDMTKPWSVYWFYTNRDLYRSKARPANIAPDPASDEELEKWMRK